MIERSIGTVPEVTEKRKEEPREGIIYANVRKKEAPQKGGLTEMRIELP